MKRVRTPGLAAWLLALAAAGPVTAQEGAITGRVIDAATFDPVRSATVSVVGSDPRIQVATREDGSFRLVLRPGTYDILVEAQGFTSTRFERVAVSGGQTTGRNFLVVSDLFRLGGFVVTPSRGSVDTEITAPSSTHSVSAGEIAARPAPSPVEHLRTSPGVDIVTEGIQSSNIVVRGFNNIFSGALHMLADYRQAALPALRVNYMHFLPLNDLDVERMELVLGPGSALYGPNTSSGVLHVITRSPLESPGTSVSLAAGERATLHGAFRSAFQVRDNLAVKFSGEAFRADEWPYVDPAERQERDTALASPGACITKTQELRGLTLEEARSACARIGLRDSRVRRYSAEARADWRYSPRGMLTGSYGITDMSGIELTGLGAAQIRDWVHQYVQARFTYDRWSVQTYFNFNDSGDAFFLRDGVPLVDRSTVGVFQVQNGFSILGDRQDFTYGWDFFSTRPESRGTIYGDFEGDNNIREWGFYLQSRTTISSKLDLVTAGRIDDHSILRNRVFSPRAAVIFKPTEDHAIRFSYNQAFSTPTALNYFLDLGTGSSGPYTIRAFGSGRNGWALQNPDGSLVGMRSPFNPSGAGQFIPTANPATLWALGVGAAGSGLPADILGVLQGLAPGDSDVGIRLGDAENTPGPLLSLGALPDIEPVGEENTETYEIGWSGVVGNRLRVAADVYHQKRNNFVSPLTQETPLLFLDGGDLSQWLQTAYVPARTANLVDTQGLSQAAAAAQAAAEAAAILPGLAAGIGQIPLAVASSDIPEMASGGADIIVTYRNLGSLSLWGADLALQFLLSPRWTLSGTYSHVSRDWFKTEGSALALNAPRHKGSLGVAFRDEGLGLDASARVRYTGSHPFRSTLFEGTGCIPDAEPPPGTVQEDCIDAYALVDLTVGYRIPGTRGTVQVGVSNLMDTPYRSVVGSPEVGRLAMVRVRYDLF